MKLLLLVQQSMRNSMQFVELAYTDGKISEEMYESVLCAHKNGYLMQDYLNEHLC